MVAALHTKLILVLSLSKLLNKENLVTAITNWQALSKMPKVFLAALKEVSKLVTKVFSFLQRVNDIRYPVYIEGSQVCIFSFFLLKAFWCKFLPSTYSFAETEKTSWSIVSCFKLHQ